MSNQRDGETAAASGEGSRGETGVAPGRCDRCGAFTELRFGDRAICEACCEAVGSCCTESEMD
jgi:hypothetical protein